LAVDSECLAVGWQQCIGQHADPLDCREMISISTVTIS